jgi:hypothetical protein
MGPEETGEEKGARVRSRGALYMAHEMPRAHASYSPRFARSGKWEAAVIKEQGTGLPCSDLKSRG